MWEETEEAPPLKRANTPTQVEAAIAGPPVSQRGLPQPWRAGTGAKDFIASQLCNFRQGIFHSFFARSKDLINVKCLQKGPVSRKHDTVD